MADIMLNAKAQDINVVAKFAKDISGLLKVMGKADVEVLPNGTALKIYKTSGTLTTEQVAEGKEITASTYNTVLAETKELVFGKYRKLTGIESIAKLGYDKAVAKTNDSMLRDVQANFRKGIYTELAKGTGATTGATFQAACANAWGALTKVFEGEHATPIYFANPMDVAGYLGAANITTQSEFGMNYIENFLGLGNVIIDSNVPEGTVLATACENINIVAANVAAIPGMALATDETGIFGVHNGAKYENGAIQTVIYSGLVCFPTYLDRVVKATVSA